MVLIIPCACIGLVGGWGLVSTIGSGPEDVAVEFFFPSGPVKVGESYPVEFHIENTGDQTQTLDSIEFSFDVLEAIEIRGSSPPYDWSESYFDWESYFFDTAIQPGETLVVTFDTLGINGGDYMGWIDVCINSAGNCLSFEGTINIESRSG